VARASWQVDAALSAPGNGTQQTCEAVHIMACGPVPHATPAAPRASVITSWTFASPPPPSLEPLPLPVPLDAEPPLPLPELAPAPLLPPPLLPPAAPSRLTQI
jgi:hypothetical protein